MEEVAEELRKIRLDLDRLTNLYSKLVERILPEEEPEEEDIKAITEEDEIVSEKEISEALNE